MSKHIEDNSLQTDEIDLSLLKNYVDRAYEVICLHETHYSAFHSINLAYSYISHWSRLVKHFASCTMTRFTTRLNDAQSYPR